MPPVPSTLRPWMVMPLVSPPSPTLSKTMPVGRVAATLSAWVFYALFGDWGIILWKITGFLTVGLYFTFVRPYRKARRGD